MTTLTNSLARKEKKSKIPLRNKDNKQGQVLHPLYIGFFFFLFLCRSFLLLEMAERNKEYKKYAKKTRWAGGRGKVAIKNLSLAKE